MFHLMMNIYKNIQDNSLSMQQCQCCAMTNVKPQTRTYTQC